MNAHWEIECESVLDFSAAIDLWLLVEELHADVKVVDAEFKEAIASTLL